MPRKRSAEKLLDAALKRAKTLDARWDQRRAEAADTQRWLEEHLTGVEGWADVVPAERRLKLIRNLTNAAIQPIKEEQREDSSQPLPVGLVRRDSGKDDDSRKGASSSSAGGSDAHGAGPAA